MMDTIPRSLNNNLNTGNIEQADGVLIYIYYIKIQFITDKNFYNGRDNLNAIHLNCNVYSTAPADCVNNSKCGWCGQSNTCIPGTSSGPLAPCLRDSFLFTKPSVDWNPLKASTINILAKNERGQPLNHIVPEPNLNNVNQFKPYN